MSLLGTREWFPYGGPTKRDLYKEKIKKNGEVIEVSNKLLMGIAFSPSKSATKGLYSLSIKEYEAIRKQRVWLPTISEVESWVT